MDEVKRREEAAKEFAKKMEGEGLETKVFSRILPVVVVQKPKDPTGEQAFRFNKTGIDIGLYYPETERFKIWSTVKDEDLFEMAKRYFPDHDVVPLIY